MIVYDLDGTLGYWEPGRKPEYHNPEAVAWYFREYRDAPFLVASAADEGESHVLTGRTEVVSVPTLRFLEDHFPWIPTDNLHMQAEWLGWDALRRWKADKLAALGHGTYVGDLEVDRLAAQDAGWQFLHADHWRRSLRPLPSQPLLGVI